MPMSRLCAAYRGLGPRGTPSLETSPKYQIRAARWRYKARAEELRAAVLPRADQRRPCEMARIHVDRNLTGEQGDAADGAGLHWGLEAISGQQPLRFCTTPPLIAQLPEVDWSTHSARLVYCHNFHGFHLTSTRHTCAIGMGWSEGGGAKQLLFSKSGVTGAYEIAEGAKLVAGFEQGFNGIQSADRLYR